MGNASLSVRQLLSSWISSRIWWKFFLSRGDAPLPSFSQVRDIMVIRLDEIGDFVLTTAFLRELRRAAPTARITLVVKAALRPLVENCPYLNQILVFNGKSDGGGWHTFKRRAGMLAFRFRYLCGRKFDLVLLPRRGPDYQEAEFLAHLCAKGASIVMCREPGDVSRSAPFASAHYFKNPTLEHEVLHHLHLLEWCGAGEIKNSNLELWLTDEDRQFAQGVLPKEGAYVALGTGAGDLQRCWPVERYAALAEWLGKEYQLKAVLFGAGQDPSFPGAINLIGRTTLRQTAASLARCQLFIGNDSGVKHLAAAVGVPVLEISAFRQGGNSGHHNSPDRFHAWGVPGQVIRPSSGSGPLDIRDITVETVQAACMDFISRQARKMN